MTARRPYTPPLAVTLDIEGLTWAFYPSSGAVDGPLATKPIAMGVELRVRSDWIISNSQQSYTAMTAEQLPQVRVAENEWLPLPPYDLLLREAWAQAPPIGEAAFDVLWVLPDAPFGEVGITTTLRPGDRPIVRMGTPEQTPPVMVGMTSAGLRHVRVGQSSVLDEVTGPRGFVSGSDPHILMLGGMVDQPEWLAAWQLDLRVATADSVVRDALRSCPWGQFVDKLTAMCQATSAALASGRPGEDLGNG